MFGFIRYVSHSIPNMRSFDYFKKLLEEGVITPHSKFKAGFSVDGCYALDAGAPHYAVPIFNFADVKDVLKPVLYLPLKRYWWYFFDDYLVTWHHLAWETELSLLKGKEIPLDMCRGIWISKWKRKLRSRLLDMGYRVLDRLPPSPLHKWAKEQLRNLRVVRHGFANEWNEWICNFFDLDYEEVKREFLDLVREKEVWRLGETCRICRFYEYKFIGLKSERRCQITGREVDFEDSCDRFNFNMESFIDLKAFNKYYR